MKIRNKLWLGFGFLFIVVLFFGSVSVYYIKRIADSTQIILKNNYQTLNYTHEMREVLDDSPLPLPSAAVDKFQKILDLQQKNITEAGEGEATQKLRTAFGHLQTPGPGLQQDLHDVRLQLRVIEKLNMQAIVKKNANARASVNRAIFFLGLTGTFTFLVLFSFSVNFPGYVANPLRALLMGIREISQKNYKQKLEFKTGDEFSEVAQAFNHMAARLNEWENSNVATLLSEKQRIELIIEQMHDAIIGVNERQDILFINNTARQLLALGEAALVGKNAYDLAQTNDLLKSILENTSKMKMLKIASGGREDFYQLHEEGIVIPNLNPPAEGLQFAGTAAGKVFVLKNITEFQERDQAKTNFIATISHELKTPISSIKMSVKLLKDERIGKVNAEQQELINHITEDSDRLLKITGELLELAQVEAGNLQLHIAQAAPMAILQYALNAVSFQAQQRNVKIEVIKPDELPMVLADAEKTAWVVVNLLSNALRYSPERSDIVIRLRPIGRFIQFSVKDSGKGIDEQYLKRLFDRYFQVPTDGQNKSGSGLGLAISKDFIEAQQGKIGVESNIGEGSTFFFTLPLA